MVVCYFFFFTKIWHTTQNLRRVRMTTDKSTFPTCSSALMLVLKQVQTEHVSKIIFSATWAN